MEHIFNCLGKEFADVEFSSMNINPSHSVTYSKNGTEEHVITLTVTAYNQVHKLVGKKVFKFINDKFKVSPSKKLDHVLPEDLDSAFMLSKDSIVHEIFEDYSIKYNTIVGKIQKLESYCAQK